MHPINFMILPRKNPMLNPLYVMDIWIYPVKYSDKCLSAPESYPLRWFHHNMQSTDDLTL